MGHHSSEQISPRSSRFRSVSYLRRIEESHSALDRRANERNTLPPVYGWSIGEAHAHAAEPDGGNLQISLSKFAFLHFLNLLHVNTFDVQDTDSGWVRLSVFRPSATKEDVAANRQQAICTVERRRGRCWNGFLHKHLRPAVGLSARPAGPVSR
jgi:hypothetical protein